MKGPAGCYVIEDDKVCFVFFFFAFSPEASPVFFLVRNNSRGILKAVSVIDSCSVFVGLLTSVL